MNELPDGTIGSVDAAVAAAIGPYSKSRITGQMRRFRSLNADRDISYQEAHKALYKVRADIHHSRDGERVSQRTDARGREADVRI